MRQFIVSVIFSLLLVCGVAHADQCALDKSVGTYAQCPTLDSNNALLATYNGLRLEPDVTQSTTPVYVHNTCRYIDAAGITDPIFIPTKTAEEWNAFLAYPGKVNVVNCCTPRALAASDVKAPTQACAAGSWHLDGLVNSNDRTKLIATTNAASTFVSVSNANISLPLSLPIARDDNQTIAPLIGDVAGTYTARWSCGGLTAYTDFHMVCAETQWKAEGNTVVVDARSVAATCTPGLVDSFTQACADPDQEGIVTMNRVRVCDGSNDGAGVVNTVQISNSCVCTPTKDLGNVTKECPTGQTGSIVVRQVRTCIDSSVRATYGRIPVGEAASVKQSTPAASAAAANTCTCSVAETPVSNTCVTPPTCTPTDVTTSRACPAGKTGSVIVRTQHICDGSNNGAGRDVVTEDSSQCRPANCGCCVPSDVTTTQACPAGQGGQILVRTTRVCNGANGGHGTVTTTQTNQCIPVVICTPSSSSVNSACPAGKTGLITTTTTRVCDGSNNGAGRDTVTSTNTCVNICIAGSSSVNSACPAGQTGQIVTTTAHICDGSNNGGGRDVVTTTNQCTVIQTCTPSQLVTCSACPAGQRGLVTTTRSHICDGSNNGAGRDTISTTNTCRPCASASSSSSSSSSSSGSSGWGGSISSSASANASASASAGCPTH
ncbi:MAG: hypothetical protein EB059_04795 [Alphaproteobacteria bacterium]|nr:hypothetical protein [Alphaproteobacteria bacterium]